MADDAIVHLEKTMHTGGENASGGQSARDLIRRFHPILDGQHAKALRFEPGEQIDVGVQLRSGHYIVMNDPFTVEVSPGIGSTLTIKRKGPASVTMVQALY